MAPSFRSRFRRDESDKHAEGHDVDIKAEASDVDDDDASSNENLVDDDSGEWLAYELHEWASQSRAMLAQLLIADKVVHSWQGTTLLAHESVEEAVDELLQEVEAATDPELDPDKAQVAFEMEGWSGQQQALLAERLGGTAVPHEFDAEVILFAMRRTTSRSNSSSKTFSRVRPTKALSSSKGWLSTIFSRLCSVRQIVFERTFVTALEFSVA